MKPLWVGVLAFCVAIVVVIVPTTIILTQGNSKSSSQNTENKIVNEIVNEISMTTMAAYDASSRKIYTEMFNAENIYDENPAVKIEYIDVDPTCFFIQENVALEAKSQEIATAIESSQTNNQQENVDEADIVKTLQKYIFYVPKHENNVVIIEYDNENDDIGILANISTRYRPLALFVTNDTCIIIGHQSAKQVEIHRNMNLVVIEKWNISEIENPQLVKTKQIEGLYDTARMTDDQHVYVIVKTFARYTHNNQLAHGVPLHREFESQANSTDILLTSVVNMTNVTYLNQFMETNAWISIVHLDLEKAKFFTHVHAGHSNHVYMSRNNIYILAANFLISPLGLRSISLTAHEPSSIVLRFSTDNPRRHPVFMHQIFVPGTVRNQFSMGEIENNYFAIATTTRNLENGTFLNHLFVYNAKGEKISALNDLAPNEKIYSCRFYQYMVYIVTFREIDPLFVISIENVKKPILLGQLKIPGFSDYLHNVNVTHLLGVGHDVNPFSGAWLGVKVSLFNVKDFANPIEQFNIVLGTSSSWTPVSYEHKAFTFWNNYISFPLQTYDPEKSFTGLVTLKIEDQKFARLSDIEHPVGKYFQNAIHRSIYWKINQEKNKIFSFSNQNIQMHNLDNFQLQAQINFSSSCFDEIILF